MWNPAAVDVTGERGEREGTAKVGRELRKPVTLLHLIPVTRPERQPFLSLALNKLAARLALCARVQQPSTTTTLYQTPS